jgi:hypothetical protein
LRYIWRLFAILLTASSLAAAADNLRLNQKLDYSSDSHDGPLITGDHMLDGPAKGKPNYVIIYGEGCYNSKHQARRTVDLWEKYKDRVNFVVVDLDIGPSPAQKYLVDEYYRGSIPHVLVLDRKGKTLYDKAGEVDESVISSVLDNALQ